jgi:hypothetical protein
MEDHSWGSQGMNQERDTVERIICFVSLTIGRRIIGNTILHCDGLESLWLFHYEVSTCTHPHPLCPSYRSVIQSDYEISQYNTTQYKIWMHNTILLQSNSYVQLTIWLLQIIKNFCV